MLSLTNERSEGSLAGWPPHCDRVSLARAERDDDIFDLGPLKYSLSRRSVWAAPIGHDAITGEDGESWVQRMERSLSRCRRIERFGVQ